MSESLQVICDDLSKNPRCIHGPTLLFVKKTQNSKEIIEYFACLASRDQSNCNFYLKKSDYNKGKHKIEGHPSRELINREAINLVREKIKSKKPEKRCFCHVCYKLFKKKHLSDHQNHEVKIGLTDNELQQPTNFLRPLSDNKNEAQYFFTATTLQFFGKTFQNLNIRKVICIGAPRLHEFLTLNADNLKIKSILLDIDERFAYFYNPDEFCWFNMFNNYFFEGNNAEENFHKFLKNERDEITLLFTDPPFGCRTEPLIETIKNITKKYKTINKSHDILPVFWIFPYFMELYIKRFMPEMEMCDYKVNYTNHEQYSDGEKGRKFGSPVRCFTNIPLNLLELPTAEGYKFCSHCNRWTMKENQHCGRCRECPSKNGETYRHCKMCETCVKPNYVHCENCRRCAQKFGHVCEIYQKNLTCWICRRKGHTEINCDKIPKSTKNKVKKIQFKNKRFCMICHKFGHNELKCFKRRKFSEEI